MKLKTIHLSLILFVLSVCGASPSHSKDVVSRADSRATSVALDRLQREFQQGWDFARISPDRFAGCFARANVESGLVASKLGLRGEVAADDKLVTRALFSYLNLIYLAYTYSLATWDMRKERDDLPLPPDVTRLLEASQFAKEWIELSSASQPPPLNDVMALETALAEVDAISSRLRGYMPANPFSRRLYKRNLTYVARDLGPPVHRVVVTSSDTALSGRKAFVIQRGGLLHVFVEEAGELRLVAIDLVEL